MGTGKEKNLYHSIKTDNNFVKKMINKTNISPIILSRSNIEVYFQKEVAPRLYQLYTNKVVIEKIDEVDDYTNSAFIFRFWLTEPKREIIYLKQTRGKSKRKDYSLPAHRIHWEAESIKRFTEIVGKKIAPDILYLDGTNNVLVIEDVLSGGELLIDAYKRGNLRPDLGPKFGSIFGKLHGQTYGLAEDYFNNPDWYKLLTEGVFYQHYLVGFENFFGKDAVEKIMNESRGTTHAFCHMDPLMKNIMLHPSTFRIVDFEQATKWDPAYDIGSLLMPWAIAILSERRCENSKKFIQECLDAYRKELEKNGLPQEEINNILKRALRFTATTMLHHTWGKDVFDFLKQEKEKIRNEVIPLLKNQATDFSNAMRTLYRVNQLML